MSIANMSELDSLFHGSEGIPVKYQPYLLSLDGSYLTGRIFKLNINGYTRFLFLSDEKDEELLHSVVYERMAVITILTERAVITDSIEIIKRCKFVVNNNLQTFSLYTHVIDYQGDDDDCI